MNLKRVAISLLLLPVGLAAQTAAVAVARTYGFSAAEVQQILAGAVLSKSLPEKSDKELAGVVAILFPQPVTDLAETLLEGKWLKFDRTIHGLQVWKPDKSPPVMRSLIGGCLSR